MNSEGQMPRIIREQLLIRNRDFLHDKPYRWRCGRCGHKNIVLVRDDFLQPVMAQSAPPESITPRNPVDKGKARSSLQFFFHAVPNIIEGTVSSDGRGMTVAFEVMRLRGSF